MVAADFVGRCGIFNGLGPNQPDLITASNSGILAEEITF